MKLIALALAAFVLGACASKPSNTSTVPPPGGTTVVSGK